MGSFLCSQQREDQENAQEVDLVRGENNPQVAAAVVPLAEAEENGTMPTEPSILTHQPQSIPLHEGRMGKAERLDSPMRVQVVENFSEKERKVTAEQVIELGNLRNRLRGLKKEDAVCMEGEMLRYKPSAHEHYVKRWCVLTRSDFKYFKSQYSLMLGDRPLVSLPVAKLLAVIVCVLARSKDSRFKIELAVAETTGADESQVSQPSLNASHLQSSPRTGHLLPRPLYLFPSSSSRSPLVQSLASDLPLVKSRERSPMTSVRMNKTAWTARENEMYRAETRLLFALESYYEIQQWKIAIESVLSA